MTQDNLVVCRRCGGNACYEQHLPTGDITWMDFGCGFTTSTQMKQGSELVDRLVATLPDLHKDLLTLDEEGFIWAPANITLPGKGVVFLDGTSKDDWHWSSIKPKSDNAKSDNQLDRTTLQKFNREDFMDACESIGFFEI